MLNAAFFSGVKVSSVYVLATHGAGYSDANDILFIRRIVRATAGLAQICQWSESVAPRRNGGQGGGFGVESPPPMFSEQGMFKNKQIPSEKTTTNPKPDANHSAWVKS